MIRVHRLNGNEIVVNADLIEAIDGRGVETVLLMATGNRYVVQESVTEVIDRTVSYRQSAGAAYLAKPLRKSTEEVKSCP